MKTTADQDNILFTLLNSSALKATILGDLYKGERPLDSNKEDIIISSMLVSDSYPQEGVANVNVYVPKISVVIDNKQQLMRDSSRIETISVLAAIALEEKHEDEYSFWVSFQNEYNEPEINQTRLNFRIEFRFTPN